MFTVSPLIIPFYFNFCSRMNISGVVIDNDGLTMPGVSVSVKGTTTGTITDIDGKYNLNVQKGATLLFSFIGYTTKRGKSRKRKHFKHYTKRLYYRFG